MWVEEPASVAQSDACPTGDQEVTGSIPRASDDILSSRLIMKYFLQLFPLPSPDYQFLAKECTQVLVNCLEDIYFCREIRKIW